MNKNKNFGLNIGRLHLYITFLLALFFSISIIYSYERISYKDKLIDALRVDYPWIDQVAWVADFKWVPHLFEKNSFHTNYSLLLRIFSAQQKETERLATVIEDNQNTETIFDVYLNTWAEQIRLCQNYHRQMRSQLNEECFSYTQQTLPDFWRAIFKEQLYDKSYFFLENGYLRKGHRENKHAQLCNFSPIDVSVTTASWLASIKIANFYKDTLGIADIGEVFIEKLELLNPGECIEKNIALFDIVPPIITFNAKPSNTELALWVDDKINQRNGNVTSNFMQTVPKNIWEVCMQTNLDTQWVGLDISNCLQGIIKGFPYVFFNKKDQFQGIISHPGLTLVKGEIVDGKFFILPEEIFKAQELTQKWSNLVMNQWALDKKWRYTQSNFLLDAMEIIDYLGPLSGGINIFNFAPLDILGQQNDLPKEGKLIALNNKAIWSIYDVYEELNYHGNSRSAGIGKRIELELEEFNEPFKARYKFNPLFPPEFIDAKQYTFGFLSGFRDTFSVGWRQIDCATELTIKSGINYLFPEKYKLVSVAECSWINTQQYAFDKQVNPVSFAIGDVGASISQTYLFEVPFNKFLLKNSKSNIPKRRIVSGVTAATVNSIVEIGIAPPEKPFYQILKDIQVPAGVGFIAGAYYYD